MTLYRRAPQWASLLRPHSSRPLRNSRAPRSWRQLQKRHYASEGGHEHKEASSDLPWALGAAAVTIPSCWYLWPTAKAEGHGHGHGEGHGEEGGSEHSAEGEESEDSAGNGSTDDIHGADTPPPKAREAQKAASPSNRAEEDNSDSDSDSSDTPEGSDSESDSSDSESDNSMKNTPETSGPDDEERITDSGSDVEGVQFKGATTSGATSDTRKHVPDSKGGARKRIESEAGKPLGKMPEEEQEADTDDKAASAKKPGDQTTSMSGKQEGISNTDTKHSTDIANDPDKSKKGEGTPETSKSKGTVDPNRPQV